MLPALRRRTAPRGFPADQAARARGIFAKLDRLGSGSLGKTCRELCFCGSSFPKPENALIGLLMIFCVQGAFQVQPLNPCSVFAEDHGLQAPFDPSSAGKIPQSSLRLTLGPLSPRAASLDCTQILLVPEDSPGEPGISKDLSDFLRSPSAPASLLEGPLFTQAADTNSLPSSRCLPGPLCAVQGSSPGLTGGLT